MGRNYLSDVLETMNKMMVESEGITENVGDNWRTDVLTKIARELPMEKMMFEAADPKVFTWYIRGMSEVRSG